MSKHETGLRSQLRQVLHHFENPLDNANPWGKTSHVFPSDFGPPVTILYCTVNARNARTGHGGTTRGRRFEEVYRANKATQNESEAGWSRH